MKRIGFFLGRVALVIVGIIVVVLLARRAGDRLNDFGTRINAHFLYNQHQPGFAQAATSIGATNVQIAFQQTNAPSLTATSSDSSDNASPVQPDEVTFTPTPSVTNAASATLTPTDQRTSTMPPTSTIPPTLTRVAIVATIPPTNTKRPPTDTPIPTSTSTPVPTATSTPSPVLGEVPSLTATLTTVATTLAPTDAATLGPTLAATNKLPTVVIFAQRTEKPQVTAIPIPAPRVKSNGNDIENILLVGSDQDVDPSDPSYRTDTMLIVSINRTTNTVAMLSIPRDLFVYIPTLGMQRINTAFQWGEAIKYQPGGGFGLLQQTIGYNLGIPIHYYAKVSLLGFKQIIDSLNGIDLAVDCPISDLKFQGNNAQQTPVYDQFKMDPGFYHMDGSTALWYARMRHSTSDFDRNRRQQQVMLSIWRTARAQGMITKAADLWGQITSIVQTNLQLTDVLGLVPMALSLKPGEISSYYMVKGYEVQHWTTPSNDDVQLPASGFFTTINNFYTPPTKNKLGAQAPVVQVINGSATKDYDKVAADHLITHGFDVQDQGASDQTAKTRGSDLTRSAKPCGLSALTKTLNLKPNQVVSQPDPNRTADFRVVLGNDYNSCTAAGFGN